MTKDEADAALRQAIIDHTDAHDVGFDDVLLSSFAIVAHWQPLDGDDQSRYTTHFDRPMVPTHQALGMFHAGIRCIAYPDEE